jgi:hypothetical protein
MEKEALSRSIGTPALIALTVAAPEHRIALDQESENSVGATATD